MPLEEGTSLKRGEIKRSKEDGRMNEIPKEIMQQIYQGLKFLQNKMR